MNALPVMYGLIVVGAPAIFWTSSGRMPWVMPASLLPAGGGVAGATAGADDELGAGDCRAHPPTIPRTRSAGSAGTSMRPITVTSCGAAQTARGRLLTRRGALS